MEKTSDFYNNNADFKRFIDRNAAQYGKSVEYMMLTPTAQEYEKYIKERDKGRINENTHKSV